jgi:hypothetical protein
MPCLLVLLALVAPRLTIALLVIFGEYIGNAYQTTIWPLLGFFFMPFTTLAYAVAINEGGQVTGWYMVLVVVAVLADLSTHGGGGAAARGKPGK